VAFHHPVDHGKAKAGAALALVEKKGSRQRLRVSSFMPVPVSLISTTTPCRLLAVIFILNGVLARDRVQMVILPPGGHRVHGV